MKKERLISILATGLASFMFIGQQSLGHLLEDLEELAKLFGDRSRRRLVSGSFLGDTRRDSQLVIVAEKCL